MSRHSARQLGRRLMGLASVLFAWMVIHAPSVAEACSVCTAGREDENAAAFLISTIFMSLLPLIALGTLLFVLWRRIQKIEAETQASRSPDEVIG